MLRAQGEAELTTLAEDTGSADTSYTDATATGLGETYAYRVRALRGEVKSQASNRTAAVIPEFLAIFTHVEGGPPVAGPDDTTLREDGDPLVPKLAQSGFPADRALPAKNDLPWGLWSNETTMWVVDFNDDDLYAYDLDTGNPDTGKDILLDTENTDARGIWSDGETMFVADEVDKHIYAYVLTPGTTFGDRDSAKDIALHARNGDPRGIWSNETTMWVVDWTDFKLYAYRMIEDPGTTETEYGTRDTSKDIDLYSDINDFKYNNTNPEGMWSNGTTMWVGDGLTGWLYAYRVTDDPNTDEDEFGDYDRYKNITLAASNEHPRGVWSNGITVWVADVEDDKLYTYFLPQTAVDVPATGQPTISGTAQVRKLLTADIANIADAKASTTARSLTGGSPATTARTTPPSPGPAVLGTPQFKPTWGGPSRSRSDSPTAAALTRPSPASPPVGWHRQCCRVSPWTAGTITPRACGATKPPSGWPRMTPARATRYSPTTWTGAATGPRTSIPWKPLTIPIPGACGPTARPCSCWTGRTARSTPTR